MQPTLNIVSGTGQEYQFSWAQLVYAGVLDQLVMLGLRHTRGAPLIECDILREGDNGLCLDRMPEGNQIHPELVRFIETEPGMKRIDVSLKYVGKWASMRGRKAMRLVFYLAAYPVAPGSREEKEGQWLSRGLELNQESFKVFSKARIVVSDLEAEAERVLSR